MHVFVFNVLNTKYPLQWNTVAGASNNSWIEVKLQKMVDFVRTDQQTRQCWIGIMRVVKYRYTVHGISLYQHCVQKQCTVGVCDWQVTGNRILKRKGYIKVRAPWQPVSCCNCCQIFCSGALRASLPRFSTASLHTPKPHHHDAFIAILVLAKWTRQLGLHRSAGLSAYTPDSRAYRDHPCIYQLLHLSWTPLVFEQGLKNRLFQRISWKKNIYPPVSGYEKPTVSGCLLSCILLLFPRYRK